MRKLAYLIAAILMGAVYPENTWAISLKWLNPFKCNSLLKTEDPNMQTLDSAVKNALSTLDSDSTARALRVVNILIRFKYTDRDILLAAVLSGNAPNAEVRSQYGANVANTLAALKNAFNQPLNSALPELFIANIDAAIIRIAERTVDVENAIVAVSQGNPEARRQYRDEFVATPRLTLPDRNALWRYWSGLCQHNVPSAAFFLSDFYVDYPVEKVKFRYELSSGKKFRKFYREPDVEKEIPSSSKLFDDAIIDGTLISKTQYYSP